ncbi:MAG: sigma-70 family RNA polymerase sigma factor [Bacteroidetes bacterium]|nr:sigma-70 family RNA polymerase sigma factor [Bacteroidota bacterium]
MDYKVMDDAELIKLYINGEEKALSALINKHEQRIFSYILSKIQNRDLANDVFQDVFVKIIKVFRSGRYNEEGKFLNWALRISHNLVIDHFRKQKRIPTISNKDDFDIFDIVKDSAEDVETGMIREQIEKDLHRLILELPPEQLEVLKLRHFSGLSFKDIADQTGVSINTALGRMRYALINLRKLMEQHNVSLSLS